jgi:hypothetical protein
MLKNRALQKQSRLKMSKFLSRATPFLLLLLSSNIYAENILLSDAEALTIDAKIYAESYGVPLDEAARRLLIMHTSQDQVEKISLSNQEKISGMYFSNGKDFALNVNVVGDNGQTNTVLTKKPERILFYNKDNRRSIRERNGLLDREVDVTEKIMITGVSVPVKFNKNHVNTKNDRQRNIDKNISYLRSILPDLEMILDDEENGVSLVYVKKETPETKSIVQNILKTPVSVIEIPTGIQPTMTRGGSVLRRVSDSALHCMTGFVGRIQDTSGVLRDWGVITAGHCITGTNLKYTDKDGTSYPIAPYSSGTVRNDSLMDLAFLKSSTTAGQQAVAEFYADSTTNRRNLTAKRTRTSTTVKSSTIKGSFICHLGQTSRTNQTLVQSCGEVTSISGANHNGGNTYVVVSNTQSGAGTIRTTGSGTLKCVRGDSGGPWFALTTAYGIQSACSWTDSTESIAKTVIYTSVDYIPSIGAALVFK